MKKQFENYLRARINDYPVYVNIGPGEDEDPITQITCGYEVGSPGWVALVFDTRPKPSIDGQWTVYIEGNYLPVTRWGVGLTRNDIEIRIGESLRDYLQAAFDAGMLGSLPLADECMLTVEEYNGAWGWGTHADDSNEAYLSNINAKAQGLSGAKAVGYWIGVLNDVAHGKYEDDDWGFLVSDLVFEKLREQNSPIGIPLLRFVEAWAGEPEFDGDRPSRKISEFPMQDPVIEALQLLPSVCEGASQEIRLLKKILSKATKANAGRKLWGIIPRWSADAMSKLCSQYPEPVTNDSTNRLMNVCDYQ